MNYETEQEEFWAGKFGTDYINRNEGNELLASNLNFFTKALSVASPINSVLEFDANIGMNLRALKLIFPNQSQQAIEINKSAADVLKRIIGEENVFNGSIFDYNAENKVDLSLIKGVLIHIAPEMLPKVYKSLYNSSNKYILVCEYYNPSPVSIEYRGHSDRLFKRDFCGEILDLYPDIKLIDYGFAYHRDPKFPQDDISWFLMEKIK